ERRVQRNGCHKAENCYTENLCHAQRDTHFDSLPKNCVSLKGVRGLYKPIGVIYYAKSVNVDFAISDQLL
ncbi:MAG: hypothetical protein Q8R95_10975, partial [Azonexus sp.]|nr:hypothetical protein [Azonexus sp.]